MTTRTLLLLLLAFLGLMIYVEWQSDYANPVPRPVESLPGADQHSRVTDTAVDQDELPQLPDLPDLPGAAPTTTASELEPSPAEFRSNTRIEVETDLLIAQIDPRGGVLTELRLKRFPIRVDQPDQPFVLLDDELPALHIAMSGLVDADRRAPNHTTQFRFDQQYYELARDAESVVVPLYWTGDDELEVVQRWVFHRDDYLIEHQIEVLNGSEQPWRGSRYLRLQRTIGGSSNGMSFTNPERISYNGAAVFSPEERFSKLPFDKFGEKPYLNTITGGWAGMVEHYFLSAWIPPADQPHEVTTRLLDRDSPNRYAVTLTSATQLLAPGEQTRFDAQLFAGPKQQNRLAEITPGLDLTVDYGIFTVFSKPLFWLLDHIHTLVRNWGLAIILLTLLIKLAFYKLTQAQFRSMGKLRKLQPRIQQLKERHGDDRQKFGAEMMAIYKKEKVNPLGGCLPILVQIPIFIALYWVLLESVELRQAGFLWVPDLSRPDPWFILPVVNGAFMIITQRLTPMVGMDPMQKKIMQWLPVAFAVMFAFFPAGLVLYWAANSGISLAQQWTILRQIDAEEARARS
ncbi:MAG: membrane protein insertase YidC [Gammaproteobacteria bacterium HGW-Gammaproteobacteria-8]|nr:MAG: membrane protein insertase YidC [Gammaproteobacteria bacterium HGW-Gammaproteobacteria-8]